MNKTTLLFSLLFGFLNVVFFQNCSKMSFVENEAPLELLSTEDVAETLSRCGNAESESLLETSTQEIVFHDSNEETGRSQVCEFGAGDNLSQEEGRMRARYEQYRALNLPDNAVICDIEMSTQLQRFRYDDVFVLTFNDRILATNNKTELHQRFQPEKIISMSDSSQIPLFKYDWQKLRDGEFANRADDYCLGSDQNKANCTWPITEQNGNIKFEFHPELLINLGLRANNPNSRFGFIVTGDNDPQKDCAHEELKFTMKVKYFLK